MTNPIDELLVAADEVTHEHLCAATVGSSCDCQVRALDAAASRVREWRARGELSDQTLLELFYAEDVSPGEVLRGLRAVERAVRERQP